MTSNNQNKKREALGKGIRSLLENIDSDLNTTSGALQERVVKESAAIERIPLNKIEVNPKQPRRDFDEQALKELSQSIKIHDIIQPVTVAKAASGKYQLISGERRWRASKLAGLKDIPAYIRKANDRELLELSLLENLQREDLNAIEISFSYKRLMEECELTQEQVAERMGKERSTVTNYLRLLKLPPDIQVAVRNGNISMGHARAIISLDNVDQQLFVYKQVIKNGLSVRQVEDLVRKLHNAEKTIKNKPGNTKLPPAYQQLEDKLASHFSTKVKLNRGRNGKGSISIEFYSDDELNRLLDQISL